MSFCVFLGQLNPPCQAGNREKNDRTRYVLIKDGYLNLRQAPVNGKPVARLKAGEVVSLQRSENGWAYIQASQGRVGFVAERYLGRLHPNQLKNAQWWALVDVWDKTNYIARPLGFRIGQNYYGFEHVAETLYLIHTSPQPLWLLQADKPIGQARVTGAGVYGCGEHPALRLQVQTTTPADDLQPTLLSAIKTTPQVLLQDANEHPALQRVLQNSGDGWRTSGSKIIVLDRAEKYLYAHLRLEPLTEEAEVTRRYLLYHLSDALTDRRPLYFEEVTQSSEVDQYGGMELVAILPSSQSNEVLLLFARSGFDSVAYEVRQLKNNTLILLFRGGGDAC